MRTFYLISSIVIAVIILVIAFAQSGATCSWYILDTNTSPILVLLQMSGLGAIMGGLLILFWKMPRPKQGEDDEANIE